MTARYTGQPPPTLFIDMDGVLADFDAAYKAVTGWAPDKRLDNVDWREVVARPGFYANLPPMPDALILWDFAANYALVRGYNIVILTGVPSSVPEAAADKRRWVNRHIGEHVPMIACRSRDKSKHAKAGDILVDDWERYKDKWLAIGGIWITHTDAASSIAALKELADES